MSLHIDVDARVGSFQLKVAFAAGRGVTALFGRSGAGKTSVVKMIAGLLRPTRGYIRVDDEVLFDSAAGIDIPAHRRRVACVFQDARLFPHLSVQGNLRYGWQRCPIAARTIDFDKVVELLGIESLLSRRPGALSGGERQRVAIGRALLSNPLALLMDEPLTSLDAPRKAEIMPYIERLRDKFGMTVVYVSHLTDEVLRLADQIVMLRDGEVVGFGPTTAMLGRIDLYPVIGRREGGAVIDTVIAAHDDDDALTTLAFADGLLLVPRVDVPIGASLRVHIAARDVAIAVQRPERISIRNVLHGTIAEQVDNIGAFTELKINLGSVAIVARVTRAAVRELALGPGREVYALVKSIAIDRESVGRIEPARYLPRVDRHEPAF